MIGMVVSPSALASSAGKAVLRRGGSAIEACVAINAVLAVVYPHFCGLGGDAVWLVADGEGQASCLMGIGQGIENARVNGPIPTRGVGSVLTTAAAISSWTAALHLWPHDLDPADLLASAIELAEMGYPVSRSQEHWLKQRNGETAQWPGFDQHFRPGGHTLSAGENFRQPDLAQTLRTLAKDGLTTFYDGHLADRIVDGLNDRGVPITRADLRATATTIEPPSALSYRGLTLLAPPPPTQGLTTLQIMGILSRFDFAGIAEDSVEHVHLVVEAVKQAFLDRPHIADPSFMQMDAASLLAPSRLEAMARLIGEKAMPWPHPFNRADTVFFGAVDTQSRCASVLQSTYFDWGSGVMAGDTGILWQNRGAAFTLVDGHPNRLRPGRLPFYTLNPGIALREGRPHLLYGTQGADGQPQTLAMLLTRAIDYGLAPAEALAGPRFLLGRTFSDQRDSLKLELDAGEAAIAELTARGHEIATIPAQSPLAGQAGLIRIDPDGSVAGAHDPRSDGAALEA